MITTEKRTDDWIAYAFGDRRVWDAGKTEAEAVGKLVLRLTGQERLLFLDRADINDGEQGMIRSVLGFVERNQDFVLLLALILGLSAVLLAAVVGIGMGK